MQQDVGRSPETQVESHLKILRGLGKFQIAKGLCREEVSLVALHALSCRCVVNKDHIHVGSPHKIQLFVRYLINEEEAVHLMWSSLGLFSLFLVWFVFCFLGIVVVALVF